MGTGSGADKETTRSEVRTAIVPVMLSGATYRLAHDSAHAAALLWNRAVDWVHSEWKEGRSPGKYDIQSFLTSLPREERPLHAHTTEMIAHDLYEAIETSRTNRGNGMKVRAPWRKKDYRPLSFSKGFGWRISGGLLHLSLGRGRPRIDLAVPEVLDPSSGAPMPPQLFGEIQLCWDIDNRQWSLHIAYPTHRQAASGEQVTAVDEGIINSMALATWVDDHTIDVTVINGREGRAIKRRRNRAAGHVQAKLARTKNGSKRHRRFTMAKKAVQGRAKTALRDFDHQVSRRAARHVAEHGTARLVYGDVRGIEQKTRQRRHANRHLRQQLSQWSLYRQERYVGEKTGLVAEHLDESGSTKTCPMCGKHNRPRGRDYRCSNPECGFTCHRDAVGAINILQRAIHGEYVPIGPDAVIRVTYLRAVARWSQDQRKAHRKVQAAKARALSSAQNRASSGAVTGEQAGSEAKSSTGSNEPGQLAAVA
jgi:putative transposase